jgi:hypothetical protein
MRSSIRLALLAVPVVALPSLNNLSAHTTQDSALRQIASLMRVYAMNMGKGEPQLVLSSTTGL